MGEKNDNLSEKQTIEKSNNKKKFDLMKILKKTPFVAKTIILVIIACLLIGIGTRISNDSNLNNDENVLMQEFKEVEFLVTQEWYGRIVEDSSKDRKIFNVISVPFTESRLIFSIDVEILAGVDFSKIEIEPFDETKIVIVRLPHSEIYKSYEVQNSFISYLDDESWFTNINSTEQQELIDKTVEKGKKQAIESGLLQKADENAKKIIENMIHGNEKTKDFEVKFENKE